MVIHLFFINGIIINDHSAWISHGHFNPRKRYSVPGLEIQGREQIWVSGGFKDTRTVLKGTAMDRLSTNRPCVPIEPAFLVSTQICRNSLIALEAPYGGRALIIQNMQLPLIVIFLLPLSRRNFRNVRFCGEIIAWRNSYANVCKSPRWH